MHQDRRDPLIDSISWWITVAFSKILRKKNFWLNIFYGNKIYFPKLPWRTYLGPDAANEMPIPEGWRFYVHSPTTIKNLSSEPVNTKAIEILTKLGIPDRANPNQILGDHFFYFDQLRMTVDQFKKFINSDFAV